MKIVFAVDEVSADDDDDFVVNSDEESEDSNHDSTSEDEDAKPSPPRKVATSTRGRKVKAVVAIASPMSTEIPAAPKRKNPSSEQAIDVEKVAVEGLPPKKGRKRSSENESANDVGNKVLIVDVKPVEMDISKDKEMKPIPPFSCHLGGQWYVRIQDYKNKRYFVLRMFDAKNNPGKGASLPLELLPFVKEGVKNAHQHVETHLGKF